MKTIIKSQKGISLIELLLAMTIGLFVMAAVFQVFSSSKKSSRLLQQEAELQEGARFAFSLMTSIIQKAGNFGCQTMHVTASQSAIKSANPSTTTFKPWKVVEGWEAKDTQYGDTYTTKPNKGVSGISTQHWTSSDNANKDSNIKSKKDSDILKVWYTKPSKANVTAINSGILSLSSIDLKKGQVLVINDCRTMHFAQVCACEDLDCAGQDTKANINVGACDTPGNNALNFAHLNIPTAEAAILEEAIFFVGKRNDSKTGYQKNPPSLYMKNLSNNAKPNRKVEILEGVESLQILYGEDTNNNNSPNYYVSANKVTDWNKVVSVKLSLLLRSRNNYTLQGTQTLKFNGKNITVSSGDHYLRKVFTTTIALRNRVIGF